MSTHHTFGIIEKDGTLESKSGSNIKSTKRKDKGEYEVMFDHSFDSKPAILGTAIHAEETPRKVINVIVDKQTYTDSSYDDGRKGAVFLIQTPDGDPNDNKFSLLAIGEW